MKPSILLIDDSIEIGSRIFRWLQSIFPECQFTQAQSLAEAQALLETTKPDCVILDIHLPDGSGIDLCATLKARVPKPVVLVFTQVDDPQIKQICLQHGAEAVYNKAFEWDQLFAHLQKQFPA